MKTIRIQGRIFGLKNRYLNYGAFIRRSDGGDTSHIYCVELRFPLIDNWAWRIFKGNQKPKHIDLHALSALWAVIYYVILLPVIVAFYFAVVVLAFIFGFHVSCLWAKESVLQSEVYTVWSGWISLIFTIIGVASTVNFIYHLF